MKENHKCMSGIQMCDIFYDQYNARLLDFYQLNKLKSLKKIKKRKRLKNYGLWLTITMIISRFIKKQTK